MVVFRLPGIYGPGRGPLSKVRQGTARRLVKRGQIFSRVHVDDIVQTVLASATWPRAGAVYNVVDDEPGPAHEVHDTHAQASSLTLSLSLSRTFLNRCESTSKTVCLKRDPPSRSAV